VTVRVLLTGLLLAGMLVGCGQSRRAWLSEDEWHNPLPAEISPARWERLDRERIHEVVADGLAGAEELLQDVPGVALTNQEAADLIGRPLPAAPGTQPYLVRGLLLIRATGSFSVHVLEGQVSVYHGSLGGGAAHMTRQPLVLLLEQPPAEVYVSVSMAK
jgi:hypothetical protein